MATVAVVAIALGCWIAWKRHVYNRDQAVLARKVAVGLRGMMDRIPPAELARGTRLDLGDGGPPVAATPDGCRKFLEYMDRSARKFEKGARYPWLVEPRD
jgi:hypothetical protein